MKFTDTVIETRILLESLEPAELGRLCDFYRKQKRPADRALSSRPEVFLTRAAEVFAAAKTGGRPDSRNCPFYYYEALARAVLGAVLPSGMVSELAAASASGGGAAAGRAGLMAAAFEGIRASQAAPQRRLAAALAAPGLARDTETPQAAAADRCLGAFIGNLAQHGVAGEKAATRIIGEEAAVARLLDAILGLGEIGRETAAPAGAGGGAPAAPLPVAGTSGPDAATLGRLLALEKVPERYFPAVMRVVSRDAGMAERLQEQDRLAASLAAARRELREEQDSLAAVREEKSALEKEVAGLSAERSALGSQLAALRRERDAVLEEKKQALLEMERAQAGFARRKRDFEEEAAAARKGFAEEKARHEAGLEDLRRQADSIGAGLAGFQDSLKDTARMVAEVAFDREITPKIFAAAGWNPVENPEVRAARLAWYSSSLPRSPLAGRNLVDETVRRFRARRPSFSSNDVINICTCLAQGFLTIFSGPPGCGKTSCCAVLADVLGLSGIRNRPGVSGPWKGCTELADRFVPVSVERGWSSRSDLVGYYNPISRTYEAAGPHRLECFRELDAEAGSGFSALPYLVLLDEANLSPMEFYFSDFMNICDRRGPGARIPLGDGTSCRIPDTLRFVATVNSDHTTEPLSPRLVDRSFIVQLQGRGGCMDMGAEPAAGAPPEDPVDWNAFMEVFGPPRGRAGGSHVKSLESLPAVFEKCLGLELSVRSMLACRNYAAVAGGLLDAGRGRTAGVMAVDLACLQRLLPRISGSGRAFRNGLERLRDELLARGLELSAGRLDRVVAAGRVRMDTYRFL